MKARHKLPKSIPLKANTVKPLFLERYALFGLFILAILPFLFFSRSVSCTFYISKSAIFTWAWLIFGIPSLWLLRDGRAFDRLKTPFSLSVLIFATMLVLSTVFSITPLVSLFGVYERQLGLMTQIQALGMTFLTIIILNDEKKIYLFADLLILAGAINAVVAIFQFFGLDFTGFDIPLGTHAYGLQGQPDLFGSVMMFTIFLNFGRLFSSVSPVRRLAFGVALLVQTAGILFSLTRGAWIGYLSGLLVFIVILLSFSDRGRRKHHLKFILIGLALLLIISAGAVSVFSDFFVPRIMGLLQIKGTAATRLILWQETLRFIWDNTINGKVFGVGLESFRRAFMPFKPLHLSQLEPNVNYDDPHNNYLGILAKMGIAGFLAWTAIWFLAARSIFRLFKQDLLNDERVFLAGLTAGLLAYAVNTLTIFDTVVSMTLFYVFLGLIVSLNNIVAAREDVHNVAVIEGKAGTPWPFFVIVLVMSVLVVVNGIYYFKAWAADNNFLYGLGNIKYYEANQNAMAPPARLQFLETTLARMNAAMAQNPIESHYAVYYALASSYYYDVLRQQNPDAAKYQLNKGIKRLLVYKDVTWEPENFYIALADAYNKLNDLDSAVKYLKTGVDDWDHQNFYMRYNLAIILVRRADQRAADGDAAGAMADLHEALNQLNRGKAVIARSDEFRHVYGQMLELEKKISDRLVDIRRPGLPSSH
ncbi:MAG: O-antigen ligase family protein [Dissulfurimicrobium hydrothermale]|uniref:O-antigen ligase family protein n=1 Tax=Dissulfurimicrobium hydrothermale TaxID=1750598 RepID=UPI003C790401